MELPKIADWTEGDLRRYIVNLLLSDPGALPRYLSPGTTLPTPPHADGDVPVWDAANSSWTTSSSKKVEGTEFAFHDGTSPPNAPSDGMLWRYPGSGFYWLFVYDQTEATYNWKFVGGAPLYAQVLTNETPSLPNGTWVDAATAGPSVTLPRDGDYDISWGAIMEHTQSLAYRFSVGVRVDATDPAVALRSIISGPSGGGASAGVSMLGRNRKTGMSASSVLKVRYMGEWSDAGTHSASACYNRFVQVFPVRVA